MKHWARKCWRNVNADDETKKRAPKNTPAGQAWAKKQSAAAAAAPAPALKTESAKKEVVATEEAAALLSTQDDLLAAALDNSEGMDVDMGRAALAFAYPSAITDNNRPLGTPAASISGFQDYHDYLSDSDDSVIHHLSEDEAEQAALAQHLNYQAHSPVHGLPVPARMSG